MPKTQRLIELIMTVNAKRRFTVKELAEEFGVSTRTMLRDLQELSAIGIPLYSEVGPNGGYRVLPNRLLPPISFTETEAVAIFFACQSLELYSSLPFEAESKSALNKFYHFLPEDTRRKIDAMKDRVMFWTPTRQQKAPFLKELLEAATKRKVVHIRYESEHSINERDILPIGLYAADGFWYCPGYCFLRKAMRLFRADRMLEVTCVDDERPLPKEADRTLKQMTSREEGYDEKLVTMKAELTRRGVRRCQFESWLDKKIAVAADGSGTIEVEVDERELGYFADYFFGLGTEAKVTAPPALVERIGEKIDEMQTLYAEGDGKLVK